MRPFGVPVLLFFCVHAYGQSELLGVNHFPETREMSGLPGGSFGIMPNGAPSIHGAMAFSTPIAYSLDNWHWAMGVNSVSPSMRLSGLDFRNHGTTSSGTAEFMVGIPTRWGALTFSEAVIDIKFRSATNLE